MVAPPREKASSEIGRARISKSGQVTIPAEVRRELGVSSGDTLIYGRNEAGQITIRKPRSAAQLAGTGKHRPDNLEEMLDEARHYVRPPYRDGSGDS